MERDTYFGERVVATYRPRALASTPYWKLAALVLGASWLSTPERAPAPVLRSVAVMAGLAIAF